MSFETVSALELPQQATELTTEELKQICGGWDCDHNNNNNNNQSRRRRHEVRRRRHEYRDDS